MSIAERIQAAETALVALKDQLVEATKSLEAAPDEESLLVQVEELSAQVEKNSKTIDALKNAEHALAARAKPVDGAPAYVKNAAKNDPKNVGDVIFKHATAKLLAHVERKSVDQVIEERYADTNYVKATFDHVQKSIVNPAMTTDSAWAGALVQNDTRGFIDSLKDVSVAAALAQRSIRLDFGGFNSITIPHRNPLAAQLTEPAWVGEAGAIPLTSFSFGSQTINRYKLAAITTMSREIVERSTPSIEALVRAGLQEAYAEVLDAALLSVSGAVPGIRPAGLLSGVTLIPGTPGGGEDAVRGDIMAAVSAMTAARVGARPVLLINNLDRLAVSMMTTAMSDYVFRDELSSGFLLGLPVIASANVPQHEWLLVDAANLAVAFDTPMFDVSDVATVVESNANAMAPTMAATAAQAAIGAVGTEGQVPVNSGIAVAGSSGAAMAGYQARSLWQTYSLGIRMVAPTSWHVMMAGSVQASTDSTWTV
jgi:HK97 family phage major capsid protein